MEILNWTANDQSPKLYRSMAILPLYKIGHGQVRSPATLYLGQPQFNFHALPSYHEFTHGFPQPLQANVRIVPCKRPQTLPSTSFPVSYSLIIQLFDPIWPQQLTPSLNKP